MKTFVAQVPSLKVMEIGHEAPFKLTSKQKYILCEMDYVRSGSPLQENL